MWAATYLTDLFVEGCTDLSPTQSALHAPRWQEGDSRSLAQLQRSAATVTNSSPKLIESANMLVGAAAGQLLPRCGVRGFARALRPAGRPRCGRWRASCADRATVQWPAQRSWGDELSSLDVDSIIVLGGGLTETGGLPHW